MLGLVGCGVPRMEFGGAGPERGKMETPQTLPSRDSGPSGKKVEYRAGVRQEQVVPRPLCAGHRPVTCSPCCPPPQAPSGTSFILLSGPQAPDLLR